MLKAKCKLEPRGEGGLEGYQLGETYRAEYRTVGASDGKPYCRVWPVEGDDYYETCGVGTFQRFFDEVDNG